MLRQTQTMRALSAAKSIDDVSDSVAETLFNDAELDILSAAFASSTSRIDTGASSALATAAQVAKVPAQPAPPSDDDDLLGLLGLGADAPLELLDDSAEPPAAEPRKTAQR
jgi:hypothetical protein